MLTIVAIVAQSVRAPEHMPTDVSRAEVQRLMAQGAQLVEVLPREQYEDEHITQAISLPLSELRASTADRGLARDRPGITYCQDGE